MSRRTIIHVLAAVAAVALLGACTGGEATPAAAQAPTDLTPEAPAEGITVTGEGRVSGQPDVLTVTVGASVTREETQAALEEANTKVAAVIDALQEQGVAEEDIQTREFSIHPEYREGGEGEPVIRGYTVNNLVEAKIRDLDRSGEIIDAAVTAGGQGARVHGVAFTLEDNAELLTQARESAVADARAKAEEYAGLIDAELGSIVSISEGQSARPMAQDFAADAAAEAAASAVPIQPGEQEVSVTVTVVWSLGG